MKHPALKFLLGLALVTQAAFASAEKPNVLFIAVDDLKPLLGCYDYDGIQTPRIDALAAQGTTFLNAHCQQAVCGPSRASLLTGMRPDTTKVWDLQTLIRDINPDVVTLPQHFKANGYTAVGVGKVYDFRSVEGGHNTDDPRSWSRPYVHFASNPDSEFGCLNVDFLAKVKEARKTNPGKVKQALGGTPPWEGTEDVPDNAYDDGAIADTGIALINELAPKDEPFFIAVGFKKPHLPFIAPKKYWDMYERSQFKPNPIRNAPEGAPEYAPQPGWELRNGSYSDVPLLSDPGTIPDETAVSLIHGYHACVSYVDAQIGKVLDALQDSGEADNTIIVLWGDHGWHLGDHGIWCKHTNYEQSTRSPLLIIDPRMGNGAKGIRNASPTEFVDIYPTLCELADLPRPTTLEGVSLAPIMSGKAEAVKNVAISQFPRHVEGREIMGYAYRTGRYRYVEWIDNHFRDGGTEGPTLAIELYDYLTDPDETRNLATDPEYADVLKEMQAIAAQKKRRS